MTIPHSTALVWTVCNPEPAQKILDLLTCKSRVATEQHLRRLTATSIHSARKRLAQLRDAGWLAACPVSVALPLLYGPLLATDTAFPDFHRLAWRLAKRHRDLVDSNEIVYWATGRASRLTGGIGGSLRQPLQIEHDLLVTEAYLQRCQSDANTATRWISEDILRRDYPKRLATKVPDALLLDELGQPYCAVEIGGSYGAQRLKKLYRAFARRKLLWELW